MKNYQKDFVITLIIAIVAILAVGGAVYAYKINKAKVATAINTTSTTTSCTPNWTCGWGPCKNGYQGMTAVDSNNCGLPAVNIEIACPAIARACSN